MANIKISVVVPFYNTPMEYFRECMQSLKKLDIYEVILVDDCSTNEELINEALNTGFKYYKTPYQSGFDGLPFNIGIQNATGDYICRVDSDDILLELPTSMSTDICFGNLDRVKAPIDLNIEQLILAPRAICNAIVVKREILLKYPFAIDPNVYGDVLLVLQLLHNGYSFCVFPRVNYIYRKVENSMQTSKKNLYHRFSHIQTVARFCQWEDIPLKDATYFLNLAMLNLKYGAKALRYLKNKKFETSKK